jgi:hypothetical protein
MLQGLRREGLKYAFSPIWFESQDVTQASGAVRKKRLASIRNKIRMQVWRRYWVAIVMRRENERQARDTRDLQKKYGPTARALMNDVHEFIRELAEKRQTDVDGVFPTFSKWLEMRFANQWETFGVSSGVADFGMVQWKGRPLNAIIARSLIQQKNRHLGKYEDSCFIIGLVDDPEFGMRRERFDVDCSKNSFVGNWKITNAFQSQWFAKDVVPAGNSQLHLPSKQ